MNTIRRTPFSLQSISRNDFINQVLNLPAKFHISRATHDGSTSLTDGAIEIAQTYRQFTGCGVIRAASLANELSSFGQDFRSRKQPMRDSCEAPDCSS